MEGVQKAFPYLKENSDLAKTIKIVINNIEDNPEHATVGYGGLPNREGDVELDAAFMDGSTGYYGGIMGAKGIANPIDAAIELSRRHLNCLLSGPGAEQFARIHGLPFRNMLTPASKKRWEEELSRRNNRTINHGQIQDQVESPGQNQADNPGHDTVCVIARKDKNISVGVSTSGLFRKEA